MDVSGTVDFVAFRHNSGGGHVPNLVGATYLDILGEPERFQVKSVRLDDLDCGPVDLIRMDAEGSEPAILRGAEALLNANPDVVICMEWSVLLMASRTSVPEFVDWLIARGFRFWRILPDATLEPIDRAGLLTIQHCDVVMARALPSPFSEVEASHPRG